MFGIFKRLFGTKQASALCAEVPELHWPPTGLFPLLAAGTSYHDEAISQLAGNAPGKAALVFCTARLVPEDTNPHDPNAVAVFIQGEKLGYLPRSCAPAFREAFARFGLPLGPTTCDAVIANGLLVDRKQYSYAIELDVAAEPESAPTLSSPSYPGMSRQDPNPVFHRQEDGRFVTTVRLGHGILDDMHKHRRMGSWTTENWSTINYYLDNRKGIGLGYKLFGIPKEMHRGMFGEAEPDAQVEFIEGRMATVSLKPVEATQ